MQTKQGAIAPCGMSRGSATTDSHKVYVAPFESTKIYTYDIHEDKWGSVLSCQYADSGLVIVNNILYSVGGRIIETNSISNELLHVQGGRDGENLPSMNTARFCPGVVFFNNIFVIGGHNEVGPIVSVEMLTSSTWNKLTILPRPLRWPSVTLCGDKLYVLSESIQGTGLPVESYSCSLVFSDDMQLEPLTWGVTAQPPIRQGTLATLFKKVVLVGGISRNTKTNNQSTLYMLYQQKWVAIESEQLFSGGSRFNCLVASPSQKIMIVIGGSSGLTHSNLVDVYTVK